MARLAETGEPLEPPPTWRARLAGYDWTPETIGKSDATVFRLDAVRRPPLFIKTGPTVAFDGLADEAARLDWLATRRIACPRVLARASDAGRDWMLMSALPGRDLASSPQLSAERVVEITADALRDLHRLDATACPFDQRLDRRLTLARVRWQAGEVDESDFDEERLGRAAVDLFDELVARRPQSEDLVVTHGDACLPNLLADDGRFTGFVDCSRLGVADRHQDLALAAWSIRYNLGEAWAEFFLQGYGLAEIDAERLSYYRLLDEFF